MHRHAIVPAALLFCLSVSARRATQTQSAQHLGKAMSFHNRLLLNRLAIEGYKRIEVMFAIDEAAFDRVSAVLEGARGRIRRSEPDIGYVRADVPIEKLVDIAGDLNVAAYQIVTLSKAGWYRDGPPQSNAEMFKSREALPVTVSGEAEPPSAQLALSPLPFLSAMTAEQPGYTADDDTGVRAWLTKHPTYDGRGVTIALLESGEPEFRHPGIGTARTLDGREVPKIAGIVDALDSEQPDRTRVNLDREVRVQWAWQRIDGRTYVFPHPGTYRFGTLNLPAGGGVLERFGVIRDESNGEIRVDANGNADFTDEAPVADVKSALDVHVLHLSHPRKIDVGFIVAAGPLPDEVHIYVSHDSHQTMTFSIAAGSRDRNGLAYGVAPAARVLFVRINGRETGFVGYIEGYLEAMRRRDVDILCDSTGVITVPDTNGDFAGLMMTRMVRRYGKPVFHSAMNVLRLLNNVSSLGETFAVGGSMSSATFSSLYGGARLEGTVVHPLSGAGPALDGAVRPDFLAPENRIAAAPLAEFEPTLLPAHKPVTRLPAGYQISCCTSASSPYAAGVAALLLSAAKQKGLSYSVDSLGRALRAGASLIPGWPVYEQGNGVLNVNAAWAELKRKVETPRIRVNAPNIHPLALYAAAGTRGVGLFERDAWRVGMHEQRTIEMTREGGRPGSRIYRVSWAGNDGTFTAPPSVSLPLGQTVRLPVSVSASSPGTHSAILDLHDPDSDAVVFQTGATIVVAEEFNRSTRTLELKGAVPLMQDRTHYFEVPAGTSAFSVELQVRRGAAVATILPSHGMLREYYGHVQPGYGRTFGQGKYFLVVRSPSPGTWSINLANTSSWRERDMSRASVEELEYAVKVRLLSMSVAMRLDGPSGRARIHLANRGAVLDEPAIELSAGTLVSHRARLNANGLPNRIDIDVPVGSSMLALKLRGGSPATSLLELHLYDCTSGECFSYDFTLPAAAQCEIIVRHPKPGRWVAAVNAAPLPGASGDFELNAIIAGVVTRRPPQGVGSSWKRGTLNLTIPLDMLQVPIAATASDATRVIVCDVVDAGLEREASFHPWENRSGLPDKANGPVTIGRAVVPDPRFRVH